MENHKLEHSAYYLKYHEATLVLGRYGVLKIVLIKVLPTVKVMASRPTSLLKLVRAILIKEKCLSGKEN